MKNDTQEVTTNAGWVLVPIEPTWDMRNEGREFLIDGLEKDYEKIAYFLWKTMVNASPKAPYSHPPVAGLAELTDEKIVCLYDAMHRAEVLTMQRKENALGQMHGVDKAVIEAAREFLGKVDG